MIKLLAASVFFMFLGAGTQAQNIINMRDIDSLHKELAAATHDTTRALKMGELSYIYAVFNLDSCKWYGEKALQLSQKENYERGEIRALFALADGISFDGYFATAFEMLFKALKMAEKNQLAFETSLCLNYIAVLYWGLGEFQKAQQYYKKAKAQYAVSHKDEDLYTHLKGWIEVNVASSYTGINQYDSAIFFLNALLNDSAADPLYQPVVLHMLGDVYSRTNKTDQAMDVLREAIAIDDNRNDQLSIADACIYISKLFRQLGQPDSIIYYSKKGLANSEAIGYKWGSIFHVQMLAEQYERIDINLAHQYLKKAVSINNELFGPEKMQALQRTFAEEQEQQKQADITRTAYENRMKQYLFIGGLAVLLLVSIVLFRNNRQKQKANNLLAEQKQTIETTLQELKSTQSQLIQSEKMASLGELTAGIAHEIQNPLNFVNNFSEVNVELIEEMQSERSKPKSDRNDQLQDELLNSIAENENKINHHGKRADAIVKGMLQHSRSSSGQKEPTDINALADEYLRLAYHGLRAKDNAFNATLKTDFESSIGMINIIPQDIGRVILNLITNAFYVVTEKKKQAANGYEPTVTVSTRKQGDTIAITITDNGNGIKPNVMDKIFQPFFTTKPTGQGTGLGLSLSYDIVKAHGGELKVETKEGEGSEFLIFLRV